MNNDLLFLENLSNLLEQGYGIEETLKICKDIADHPSIDCILQKIYDGENLTDALLDPQLPALFIEFFTFFSMRSTVSEAIKNSLRIYNEIYTIKKNIIAQLTYTIILLVFLLFFSLFATFVLFPKVTTLFDSFGMNPSLSFSILFGVIRCIPILIIGLFMVSIVFIVHFFISLKKKKYWIIERYLKVPFLRKYIQKYFTFKFCLYFNELLEDHIDSNTIITMLNERMAQSDIKIVLYEIYSRLKEGEQLEDIIDGFVYFDHLFVSMYKMFLKNPEKIGSMKTYLDISQDQIRYVVNRFTKFFVPIVYGFVAFFVITIYIAVIIPMMNVIGDI